MFTLHDKCPFCGKTIKHVNAKEIKIVYDPMIEWRGLRYLCPSCGAILSIQRDPRDVNRDLIRDLIKELKSPSRTY